ncbi:sensor histidine kinase [Nocardiopsis sp. NPDC050513]|uniref:sensor histidine kinase n=1 Tax=Nocardiopsis sp. NPDC050513 TaxID=3364338 RepID=UPI0037A4EB88
MHVPEPLAGRRWPRWVGYLLSAAGSAMILAVALMPPPFDMGADAGSARVATSAVAVVLPLFRSDFPRATAAAASALLAVASLLGDAPFAVELCLLIALYTAARRTDRRTTLVYGGAALAAVLLSALAQPLEAVSRMAGLVGFAAALGDAGRSRQAYIQAVTERARRAEETRESEARRRVAEERLRISRDLHDALAHQIAVVNLHSGVASRALPDRPEDAERALATIREAARTVLSEMSALISVLRTTDPADPEPAPVAEPVPTLADLDRLVRRFTESGLRVDLRFGGESAAVPEPVGIVAYRVVQEALTNAHKHGADHVVMLSVEYGDDRLEITATNPVEPESLDVGGTAGGHGLVGARERVASVGGSLDAAIVPGPVFRLRAVLPLRRGSR